MAEFIPSKLGKENIEAIRRTVVIRWSGPITTFQVFEWLCLQRFKIITRSGEPSAGWPMENEKVMLAEIDTSENADILCRLQYEPEFSINENRLKINKLIQSDGISIKDSVDYLCVCNPPEDDEMFYLYLVELLTIFDEGKVELIDKTIYLIMQLFQQLIYKCRLQAFGSYASPLRRLASSDLDLTFFIDDSPDDENDPSLAYCRTPEDLTPDKFDMVFVQALNKREIQTLPKELIVRIIYHCLHRIGNISPAFDMHYTSNARTPLLVMKFKEHANTFTNIDISVSNHDGVLKSSLLQLFIEKDNSPDKKMRQILVFFIHWARCNRILNGVYPAEKFHKNCGFNSYIFTHMVIHFVQAFTKKCLVQHHFDPDKRIVDYNVDEMFPSITMFIRELFKYLSNFDWTNNCIYGNQALSKDIVHDIHKIKASPMVIVDPSDLTHNMSSRVAVEELRAFKQLLANSLLILKKKNMTVNMLLEANRHASAIILERTKFRTTTQNGNTLNFELPEIIQTSAEFLVLLNSIIRFDVSSEHVGTSETNLFTTTGVTFVVYGRAWIGRRNMRRILKNSGETMTNLELELQISKSFEFSYDEPFAVVNVTMSEVVDSVRKIAHFEVIRGDMADIRDAMHFLLDQFIVNNLEELAHVGIMSLMSM